MVYVVLLLACGLAHWDVFSFTEPLTAVRDLDGLRKLEGIAADPSARAMLGYFVGDDPQRVHTFRPVPAAGLWLQWHLWGFTRWPYQIVNWLLFAVLGLRLMGLARSLGVSPDAAVGVALFAMVVPSRHNEAILHLIATLHDLLLGLFSVIAVQALTAFLADGQRRHLTRYVAWSLLAYLCKEAALALVPLTWALALFAPRRVGDGRRRALAAGWSLVVAVVWFGWYRLAVSNMDPLAHDAHTFGGMALLLSKRWPTSLVNLLFVLCEPVGGLTTIWISGAGAGGLGSGSFYLYLFGLAVTIAGARLLWRTHRGLLVLVLAWRLACMLPVLPLNNTWAWYHFTPKLLDGLLLVPIGLALRDACRRSARLLACWAVARGLSWTVGLFFLGSTLAWWHSPESAIVDLAMLAALAARRADRDLSERESGR